MSPYPNHTHKPGYSIKERTYRSSSTIRNCGTCLSRPQCSSENNSQNGTQSPCFLCWYLGPFRVRSSSTHSLVAVPTKLINSRPSFLCGQRPRLFVVRMHFEEPQFHELALLAWPKGAFIDDVNLSLSLPHSWRHEKRPRHANGTNRLMNTFTFRRCSLASDVVDYCRLFVGRMVRNNVEFCELFELEDIHRDNKYQWLYLIELCRCPTEIHTCIKQPAESHLTYCYVRIVLWMIMSS